LESSSSASAEYVREWKPVAVMTLPSLPPTNVWVPRKGALDYFIGNWLPYFDKYQGNDWDRNK
jgi:hypothetical protein